jgi:uncharacterized hydrophobic protein (TIGR00271 family)
MLHIRVVTAPGRAGLLLDRLHGLAGIQNLVVLEGAARRPDGDAVFFDVEHGAANPVFRAMRGLGVDHDGAITVQQVDASLTSRSTAGAPAREIAPVWEMVEATIRGGAVYSPSFFVLLAIAGLIGAVGILTNSQILIVGAMVVGPEYGAIIAVALGISQGSRAAVREGLLALVAGFSAAIALTLAFGVAVRAAGKVPVLFLHDIRPVSALIDSPNLFSVVVAILAGIAGVVSLTQSRAGALVGVFISVTTIPAAADTGLSAAMGSWNEAGGSALQLLLNVVLLIVVGAAGLNAQRAIWRRLGARRRLPGSGVAAGRGRAPFTPAGGGGQGAAG